VVDVRIIQVERTLFELEVCECSSKRFAISIVDEMPSENLILMLEVLDNVSISSSVHVYVCRGWAVIEKSSVGPNSKNSVSDSTSVLVIWFIIDC